MAVIKSEVKSLLERFGMVETDTYENVPRQIEAEKEKFVCGCLITIGCLLLRLSIVTVPKTLLLRALI